MHFVNKLLLQVLPNHINTAEDANILFASRFAGTFQRHMNAFRNKMERRSAFHGDGGSGVMSEYECWTVIGWVLTPPPFPVIIGPRPATQCEHISPENPRADIGKASHRKIVVYSFVSPFLSVHLAKGGSLDHPVV